MTKKAKKKSKKSSSVNIKINGVDRLIDKAKYHTSSAKNNCGRGFYFLGALGTAIYYISTATGFWVGVLGILKALVWPAFLVFEIMKFLGL